MNSKLNKAAQRDHIGSLSQDCGPVNLYTRRSVSTGALEFVRVSNNYRPDRWWRPHFIFGAFIGRTNYGGRGAGCELFSSSLHAGYLKRAQWGVTWSGSQRDPRSSYTLHIGRLFIGSLCDEWLKRLVKWRQDRSDQRAYIAWEASLSDEERALFNGMHGAEEEQA